MELFDIHVSNLIQKPICFMQNCKPSLLDVLLTNSKSLCIKTLNFATGISDCHNMISTVINNQIPKNEKQKLQYRSFRSVDTDALNLDMKTVRITGSHQDENFNFHSVYDNFETDFRIVLDKHIPIEERFVKNNQLPYMNRTFRKAIYSKKMVYHKYLKNKKVQTK